jgi:hypothetical protein
MMFQPSVHRPANRLGPTKPAMEGLPRSKFAVPQTGQARKVMFSESTSIDNPSYQGIYLLPLGYIISNPAAKKCRGC